jgi:pimeloyl-ACP methyl ester carboxylesterase
MSETRRRRAPLLALLATAALALAACGSGEAEVSPERDQNDDVAFTGCDEVECAGEIDGAAYEIVMPETWNGTLLLYSHGYRQAEAAPPDFAEPATTPEPAPGWPGSKEIGQALLDQGYAIAGSAYASNGWAVAEGVEAGNALYDYFAENVARPNRTYVWGDSLGGLITANLAEQHPEWVSGAAPLCGVVAGPNKNLDLALDVAYAIKTLIYPELEITGYASWDEAVQNWTAAAQAVQAAGSDVANGVPKILLVAALADAPNQTATQDGSTITSQVTALAESTLTALGYGTFGRYDIEQRVGGNPSGNEGVDYATRVSAEERALIEQVSPGATDRLLAQLAAGQRIAADTAARAKLAATGTPTGDIEDPVITLHTKADPLVLSQNETVYAAEVADSEVTGELVQLYTVPPATYSSTEGAPYGAGHCNFTPESRLAVIDLLDAWVRDGVYPGANAVADAMGADSGYNALYRPGPWPADES